MSTDDPIKPNDVSPATEAEALLHVINSQDAYFTTLILGQCRIQALLHVLLNFEASKILGPEADPEKLKAEIKESIESFESALVKAQVARLDRLLKELKAHSENPDQ